MHWISLIPCVEPAQAHSQATSGSPGGPEGVSVQRWPLGHAQAQQLLAWWALQFTPRVALLEEAVVLEVSASLRLFGGAPALRERLHRLAPSSGFQALAEAPTSLAALALSRQGGQTDGAQGQGERALARLLDPLPLHTLTAVHAHQHTLARLGCRNLGQVRRLPRGGLARRLGATLIEALDQAYGDRPERHTWVTLPEVFDERLELPGRVDNTPSVVAAAGHLLARLEHWLAARRAGVKAVVLRWRHDMPARAAGPGGAQEIRTAQPLRHMGHLARLLAEHLARVTLQAPVGELSLHATEIEPLPDQSRALLPELAQADGEALLHTLEKLSIRLGPGRVQRPRLRADHRPGHMQDWVPAVPPEGAAPTQRHAPPDYAVPLPGWLLPAPQPLAHHHDHPHFHGPLTLLAGPHRVEGGWWDTQAPEARFTRDYFVAASPKAGLLWIYRERLSPDEAAGWFLQGCYG